jgi:agmatinase
MKERLERLLRPAGGGVYTVSTGTSEQRRLQRRIYGVDDQVADQPAAISEKWRAALERVTQAKLIVLGVPSDVGAGFLRGANIAPQAIRRELLATGSFVYRDPRVVDIGDVLVVPQLLHDEMLSPAQLTATRQAVYGSDEPLPVSPLSVCEEVLRLVRRINPDCSTLVLGGDHSVGWPSLKAVAEGREHQTGILHFDAHTDLMEARLGVRYCFATWAYHANELIGRNQRLVQVGLRISRRTRAEWERELDVRQLWMAEMRERPIHDIAAEIIATWQRVGVRGVYVSNDIDGTDPLFAHATGTPEPGGLDPDQVLRLIDLIGRAFPIWGSDLVEVAPPLAGHSPREPATTLRTAARYVEAQARRSLGD